MIVPAIQERSALEQAGIDLVAAVERNEQAEPSDWMLRRAELDAAWFALKAEVARG